MVVHGRNKVAARASVSSCWHVPSLYPPSPDIYSAPTPPPNTGPFRWFPAHGVTPTPNTNQDDIESRSNCQLTPIHLISNLLPSVLAAIFPIPQTTLAPAAGSWRTA